MFELTKGKMRLATYNKQDIDMYVKAGWKLETKLEEEKPKKKQKQEKTNQNVEENLKEEQVGE